MNLDRDSILAAAQAMKGDPNRPVAFVMSYKMHENLVDALADQALESRETDNPCEHALFLGIELIKDPMWLTDSMALPLNRGELGLYKHQGLLRVLANKAMESHSMKDVTGCD